MKFRKFISSIRNSSGFDHHIFGFFSGTQINSARFFPFMDYRKMYHSYYQAKQRAYLRHVEKRHTFRRYLSLVRFSNRCGNHLNCIRFSTGESLNHVYKKVEICCWLRELGHDFLTEAIFLNGSRCDVLDITEGVVYEVLHSETEEQLAEKIKQYPQELRIVKVRC